MNSLIFKAKQIWSLISTNAGRKNELDLEEITSDGQLEKVKTKGLTLVDFGTPWCTPCRLQEPILRRLVAQFEGRVVVAAVNVDEFREMSSDLVIRSIPTLILFKNGKEIQRFIGLQSEFTLSGALNTLLDR